MADLRPAIGSASVWRWILFPLLALGAAAAAMVLVHLGRFWVLPAVAGTLALIWVAWTLASVLSPGRIDRACPRCGKQGLTPIRKGRPLGVRCRECGYLDETGHIANLDGG